MGYTLLKINLPTSLSSEMKYLLAAVAIIIGVLGVLATNNFNSTHNSRDLFVRNAFTVVFFPFAAGIGLCFLWLVC